MSQPIDYPSRDHLAAEPVRKVELLISTILRVGVITSLAVVVVGLVLSFAHHRDYARAPGELRAITLPAHEFPHHLDEVVSGLAALRGQAVIMAGLLLLIATPVLRVAVSIFAFLLQRDWPFVAVTVFVLAMLILSFFLGKAEA